MLEAIDGKIDDYILSIFKMIYFMLQLVQLPYAIQMSLPFKAICGIDK